MGLRFCMLCVPVSPKMGGIKLLTIRTSQEADRRLIMILMKETK